MSSHDPADLDSSVFAGHHSLGPKANQAAPGNHFHKSDFGDSFVASGVGPYGAPIPTSGVNFTLTNVSDVIFECFATAYNNSAAGAVIEVWVDGAAITTMRLNASAAVNVHMQLSPVTFKLTGLAPGVHWIAFRQTLGISDAQDNWSLSGFVSRSGGITPVANSQDTGWIDVTFLNSWVNFDARTVQYRKINGIVYTQGIAKNGVLGSPMFNYPPKFRPRSLVVYDKNLPIMANSALGTIGFSGTGDVTLTAGSTAWVDLSGIPPFPADN